MVQFHSFRQLFEILCGMFEVEENIIDSLHEFHLLQLLLALFDKLSQNDANLRPELLDQPIRKPLRDLLAVIFCPFFEQLSKTVNKSLVISHLSLVFLEIQLKFAGELLRVLLAAIVRDLNLFVGQVKLLTGG
jgi:hypothetical protein